MVLQLADLVDLPGRLRRKRAIVVEQAGGRVADSGTDVVNCGGRFHDGNRRSALGLRERLPPEVER